MSLSKESGVTVQKEPQEPKFASDVPKAHKLRFLRLFSSIHWMYEIFNTRFVSLYFISFYSYRRASITSILEALLAG